VGTPATDRAGNPVVGKAAATAANSPPAIEFTSGAASPLFTSDPRPTFQGAAVDADGSVVGIEASIDGGPFRNDGVACTGCTNAPPAPGAAVAGIPVSWTYQPRTLGDGVHTLVLRSVDNGGATSPVVARTVVVDASRPQMKVVMSAPGSRVVSVLFSKPVACSSVNPGNFSVMVDGALATPVVATCMGGSNALVDLGLSQAPGSGQVVKVSLDRPAMDDAGNRSAAPVVVASLSGLTPADLP